MTATTTSLKGIRLLLSASLPDELVGTVRAQELYDLLTVLVGGVLSSGGSLIFGGHPTITPLVHRIGKTVGVQPGQIQLFQVKDFLKPPEVADQSIFGKVQLCDDLTTMRECMAGAANAAVFAGGRTSNNVGGRPGIRDEFERFLNRHRHGPAYLLGTLGGETSRIIAEVDDSAWGPRELTARERRILQSGDSVDLAASLILSDLSSICAEMSRD